jgi:hypothetical protein
MHQDKITTGKKSKPIKTVARWTVESHEFWQLVVVNVAVVVR